MTSFSKLENGPRLPRRFGRYTLFDMIGKGGMAEIFLARQATELGGHRLCVVKQIVPAFADHAQFADMLIHEAKLAARLDHAHIVQVFDLGRADEQLYIAMEYVEGFDLNELLRHCTKQKVPLPFEFAILILCDALRGLDYAHRRADDAGAPLGIVHRDVSPSNVLISFEGESKLCDFGIAHANDTVTTLTPADGVPIRDALQGKAGYMSPEHARGEPVDARGDVFAVGILLWELVAGRRMYKVSSQDGTLLEQARRAQIPVLPSRDLPDETTLAKIVMRALEPNAAARYPSANAMLRELEAYAAAARLVANPLRFGQWLVDSFGTDLVIQRRMRQRGAEALERGPAVVLTPLPFPAAANTALPEAPVALPQMPPSVARSVTDCAVVHTPSSSRAGRGALALVVLLLVAIGLFFFHR